MQAGPSAALFRQLPDTCRNGAALGPAYLKTRRRPPTDEKIDFRQILPL
jgi:hypothetical protein